jgi:hypothetical protein
MCTDEVWIQLIRQVPTHVQKFLATADSKPVQELTICLIKIGDHMIILSITVNSYVSSNDEENNAILKFTLQY